MSRNRLQAPAPYAGMRTFGSDENIEVRNVMMGGIGVPRIFSLDVLMDEGWLRGLTLQLGEEERDRLIRVLKEGELSWYTPRDFSFINVATEVSVSVPVALPTSYSYPIELIEDHRNDWVQSPEEILERLASGSTSVEDRITAVLFAETIGFNAAQKPNLLRDLYRFAKDHRFSRNDEMITAVGSAIRKFAMNMPESSFEDYSELLVPTDTDTLPCEIELELAKAIGWRLIKAERIKSGQYPNLEKRLSGLASDYLTPRLVLQKNFASIVMHAVLAVGLLNGSQRNKLIDRITMLNMDWFSDLFARRLADIIHKRQAVGPRYANNLKLLHKRLGVKRQRLSEALN